MFQQLLVKAAKTYKVRIRYTYEVSGNTKIASKTLKTHRGYNVHANISRNFIIPYNITQVSKNLQSIYQKIMLFLFGEKESYLNSNP